MLGKARPISQLASYLDLVRSFCTGSSTKEWYLLCDQTRLRDYKTARLDLNHSGGVMYEIFKFLIPHCTLYHLGRFLLNRSYSGQVLYQRRGPDSLVAPIVACKVFTHASGFECGPAPAHYRPPYLTTHDLPKTNPRGKNEILSGGVHTGRRRPSTLYTAHCSSLYHHHRVLCWEGRN